MTEDTTTLELNQRTNLLSTECECPKCGDKYRHGVPYVNIPCKNCGITYRSDFKQDIYTKKARQMIAKISYNNQLTITATQPHESSLISMRHHFIEQGCWDVSNITTSTEEYKRCTHCGLCFNCITCKSCHTPFQKNKNLKKQTCPTCQKVGFTKTYFQNAKTSSTNKHIIQCPHCQSDKIKMTRTKNKTRCHLCNSNELSPTKTNTLYTFTVKRRKAFKRENIID